MLPIADFYIANDQNCIPLSSNSNQTQIELAYITCTIIQRMCKKLLQSPEVSFAPAETKVLFTDFFLLLDEKMAKHKGYVSNNLSKRIRDFFFKTHTSSLNSTYPLAREFETLSQNFLYHRLAELGNLIYQPTYLISEKERALSKYYTYLLEPTTCLQFVLHMLNLKPLSTYPLIDQCIQVASPEKGDVVIYGQRENNQFTPRHFGIYFSSDCIYSKWGKDPEIIEHSLNSTLPSYGNTVKFVRREVKYDCQRVLKSKLIEAQEGELIPYTQRGLIQFFIDFFKRISKRDLQTSLENSLFGSAPLAEFRKLLIKEFKKLENFELSRLDFIRHMVLVSTLISDSQPIIMPKSQN